MASNINPSNIDGTYPVAGQDNDSQGFRDNFTNSKNNFTYAKAEIEDMQNKVVLKEPLSGQTVDGNFNNLQRIYQLKGAIISDQVEQIFDHGTTSGTIQLNHQSAHYQTVTTDNPLTLTFSGFLNGKLCRVLAEITIVAVGHTVTLDNGNTYYEDSDLQDYNSTTKVFTFSQHDTFPKTFWFEFTSTDGGSSFLVKDLTRNKLYQHSANLATTSNVTAHTLDLSATGTEVTALTANANVTISYSATGNRGKTSKVFVQNLLGSNISVLVPDTNNNLAANAFGISTLATASIEFTAMDDSNSNVFSTIVTG